MAPKIELVEVVPRTELGEGPHWDQASQALFFVDIFGKTIHKYIPTSKKHFSAKFQEHVSLIVPVEGTLDQFVIGLGNKLALVTWDGISNQVSKTQVLCEIPHDPQVLEIRWNDGKCDPFGKLWAGTMGVSPDGQVKPEEGSFLSLVKNKPITHLTKVGISNGLAWNLSQKKFYYIDSMCYTIDQFDFDEKSGQISNRKPIFTMSKHGISGLPDGMCIDTEGNLWVAIFDGNCVIKIDPRTPETLLETIEFPAKQITSVAFGGPNLDELYVTTGCLTIKGVELPPPNHGATFKVTGLGVKGFPGVSVKL